MDLDRIYNTVAKRILIESLGFLSVVITLENRIYNNSNIRGNAAYLEH